MTRFGKVCGGATLGLVSTPSRSPAFSFGLCLWDEVWGIMGTGEAHLDEVFSREKLKSGLLGGLGGVGGN